MQSKLSKLHTKALSLIHRAWPENLGYERNGCNLCVLCSELGVQLASQRGQEWPHREQLNLLPGQNLDDFTVPLCSSNGRHMPAVKAAQGDSQWVLKSEVNYHQEICTKYCIATYPWLSAGEHSPGTPQTISDCETVYDRPATLHTPVTLRFFWLPPEQQSSNRLPGVWAEATRDNYRSLAIIGLLLSGDTILRRGRQDLGHASIWTSSHREVGKFIRESEF